MNALLEHDLRKLAALNPFASISVGWYFENKRDFAHIRGARVAEASDQGSHLVYEIGSVTKIFTATALAMAVNEGLASYDDPIRKFLDDKKLARARIGRITLGDLAMHTSGLPRLPPTMEAGHFDANDPYARYTREDLITDLLATRRSLIGRFIECYSNFGYGLLGTILEIIYSCRYEELIRSRICAPLKLAETFVKTSPSPSTQMVPGFGGDGNPAAAWNFEALAGCGALRSCAADLLVLLHRLFISKLSSLDDALLATISVKVRCLWHSRIGLAWQDYFESGELIHWHNGATGGFSSFIGVNHIERAAVVILANMNLIGSGKFEGAIDKAGLKALRIVPPPDLAP